MGEKAETGTPKKKHRPRKKQLCSAILKQMEFYFSEAALSKDRFLSQLIAKDPYVPIEVFLTFNKIKALTEKTSDIAKALAASSLLEVSEDGTKVKRTNPLGSYDPDPRTVYVESIPASADMKWLTETFEVYGPVAYISLPKYHNTNRIKGFAFIEYKNPSDAEKCLAAFTALGCKLPTSVKPEELASCHGFQSDVSEAAPKKNIASRDSTDNLSSEEPPTKKQKIEEKEDDVIPKNENVDLTKVLNSDTPELPEASSETENSANPVETDSNIKSTRKRKKRDRKKTKDVEKDGAAKSLQVLSKREWKVLRNKYLNMQRKHMEELKRALRTRHTVPDNRNRIAPPTFNDNEIQSEDQESKPQDKVPAEIPFVEGVIVAGKLSEPCLDVKQLKQATKANVHVKYVDIKEGSTDVYIRMDDSITAKQFATSGIFPEARILDGDEEKLYWDELRRQQSGRSSSKRKMRGRDRLIKKAQQITATIPPVSQSGRHIRFDD